MGLKEVPDVRALLERWMRERRLRECRPRERSEWGPGVSERAAWKQGPPASWAVLEEALPGEPRPHSESALSQGPALEASAGSRREPLA